MPTPLQVGDRIRLTSTYHGSQYRPGDAGIIVAVLPPHGQSGQPVYQVRMDGGQAALYPTFHASELERST